MTDHEPMSITNLNSTPVQATTMNDFDFLDEDGYPTPELLDLIHNWHGTHAQLWELLKQVWHWPEYIVTKGKYLELHTGGWSGNEDIIRELEGTLFWFLYWEKSERGGHHYFKTMEGFDTTVYNPIDEKT